jgi:glutamyl-tRNA synthetase
LGKYDLAQRERVKTLKEMAQNSRFIFVDQLELDPKAAVKSLMAEAAELLTVLAEQLRALAEWSAPVIHGVVEGLAQARGVDLGKIAQPSRVAVSGGTVSPPVDVTLELVGRARTLERLQGAIAPADKATPFG